MQKSKQPSRDTARCRFCPTQGQRRWICGKGKSAHWCKGKKQQAEDQLRSAQRRKSTFAQMLSAGAASPAARDDPVPVRNLGNTCHLGSVLCSLAALSEVRDAVEQRLNGDPVEAPVTQALQNVFAELDANLPREQQTAISVLVDALPSSKNWDAQGSQADSRDAFLVLLEKLAAEGALGVCGLFKGQMTSVVECQEGHTAITKEAFSTYQLHVPRTSDLGPCSISSLLDAAGSSWRLEGDECSHD